MARLGFILRRVLATQAEIVIYLLHLQYSVFSKMVLEQTMNVKSWIYRTQSDSLGLTCLVEKLAGNI